MINWRMLFYSVFSLVFTLVFSDLILRCFMSERIYLRAQDQFFEYSTEFHMRYRFTPNVDSNRDIVGDLVTANFEDLRQNRNEHFVTDNRGFRNSFVPEGPIKYIILGDSYGLGANTTQKRTWGEILHSSNDKLVYNLSLPGSPADELYILTTELPRLNLAAQPILIWMLFSGNDLSDSYASLNTLKGAFETRPLEKFSIWSNNLLIHSPILRLLKGFFSKSNKVTFKETIGRFGDILFLKSYQEFANLSVDSIMRLPNWPRLIETFSKMSNLTKSVGIKVLVVIAPSKEELYLKDRNIAESSSFAIALKQVCNESGFDCLDLKPKLSQAIYIGSGSDPRQLLWWRDDTHWNEEGNAIVSEVIQERLMYSKNLVP